MYAAYRQNAFHFVEKAIGGRPYPKVGEAYLKVEEVNPRIVEAYLRIGERHLKPGGAKTRTGDVYPQVGKLNSRIADWKTKTHQSYSYFGDAQGNIRKA